MTIPTEVIEALKPGDRVRLIVDRVGVLSPPVEGVLYYVNGTLLLGNTPLRLDSIGPTMVAEHDGTTLEVLEKAPTPFYSNSDRIYPVVGDVVKAGTRIDGLPFFYVYVERTLWAGSPGAGRYTNWRGLTSWAPDTAPIFLHEQGKLVLVLDGKEGKPVTE